jgi:hypothetical protein
MTAPSTLLAGCLLLVSASLYGAEAPAEPCDTIRARIGVVPLADPDFLREIAARKDCAFTAAEVYRAAYGDRPLPPEDRKQLRHRHDDDD